MIQSAESSATQQPTATMAKVWKVGLPLPEPQPVSAAPAFPRPALLSQTPSTRRSLRHTWWFSLEMAIVLSMVLGYTFLLFRQGVPSAVYWLYKGGLISQETAVGELVGALMRQDASGRTAAAAVLAKMQPVTAIPWLVGLLTTPQESRRKAVTLALEKIDPHWARSEQTKGAVPKLVEALTNGDRTVRLAAAAVLGTLRPGGRAPVWELAQVLTDNRAPLRAAAAEVLGTIGPEAQAALPGLVAALTDATNDVRREATAALEKIAPQWRQSEAVRTALPGWVAAIKDERLSVSLRTVVIEVLGQVGPEAKGAVPELVAVLSDAQSSVRTAAPRALEKIAPGWRQSEPVRAAIPRWVIALKDTSSSVRVAAAAALGQVGAGARAAVPQLREALKDQDRAVRQEVAEALGKIRPGEATRPGLGVQIEGEKQRQQGADAKNRTEQQQPGAQGSTQALRGTSVRVIHTARRTADATKIVKRLTELGADASLFLISDGGPGAHVGRLYYKSASQLEAAKHIRTVIADLESVVVTAGTDLPGLFLSLWVTK